MLFDLILFLLIVMISIPFIGAYYASTRGRSFAVWYLICFFLPVISFIILFFLPDKRHPIQQELSDLRIQHKMLGLKAEVPQNDQRLTRILKKSRRSKVHFSIKRIGVEGLKTVEIFVDGQPFAQLVEEVERKAALREKLPLLAGAYEGLPAQYVLLPSQHLMGEPHIFLKDAGNRCALLVCNRSGMCENWTLTAKVEVMRKYVVWHEFRNPQKPYWRYDSLQPLVFSRLQYQEALEEVFQLSRNIVS